jgi:hypothetical protein
LVSRRGSIASRRDSLDDPSRKAPEGTGTLLPSTTEEKEVNDIGDIKIDVQKAPVGTSSVLSSPSSKNHVHPFGSYFESGGSVGTEVDDMEDIRIELQNLRHETSKA